MEDGEAAQSQRRPRYAGEDLSPTTTRELRGFYAYGLAAEVFAVCGVGKCPLHPKKGPSAKNSSRVFSSRDSGAIGSRAGSFVVG